ncbi:Crp/Fnr family transcriptional regulator [uncultured Aquimarina sp.]|uniref:Crp/Fnr family transcriptional regulator n=1 Tax=uncultured Aquimarina sp. TaxID=575652 RepID=UPI0026279947|nr:Crp/Fnr family transcriptional regulator [uncultured Aquimarina sp.]
MNVLIKNGHYKKRTYNKAEVILPKARSSDKIYYIKKGYIKASYISEKGYETIAIILIKNQVFGINIYFYSTYSYFSYSSINDSVIYEFEVENLSKLKNTDTCLIPLLLLGEEYFEMEKRIRILNLRCAKKRLALSLIELQEKLSCLSSSSNHDDINYPFNQNELADYTRTSRVTTNNFLNEFKKKSLLEYKNQHLFLKKDFFRMFDLQ